MDKKIELEVDGRIIRCMPSMLEDMMRFGATKPKKIMKDVPIELLTPIKMVKPKKEEPPIESKKPEKKILSLDYDIRLKGNSKFVCEVFDSAGKVYNKKGLVKTKAIELLKSLEDETAKE